ncbi:MAG: ribulose-phosphate 3-epimerase [Armatimonadota bacterium]
MANPISFSPSLLSSDFAAFGQDAKMSEEAGAELLHFDVMDGQFVPNITFGAGVVKALRPHSKALFDVHLMIETPDRYVEDFARAGSDIITVHAEACIHLQRVLSLIRQCGAKAGVALNPHTPLCILENVLDDIDLILIMTVNPGFGGQNFIPQSLPKVLAARKMLDDAQSKAWLEVDGGVNSTTIGSIANAGADMFVAGSALFGHPQGFHFALNELRSLAGSAR